MVAACLEQTWPDGRRVTPAESTRARGAPRLARRAVPAGMLGQLEGALFERRPPGRPAALPLAAPAPLDRVPGRRPPVLPLPALLVRDRWRGPPTARQAASLARHLGRALRGPRSASPTCPTWRITRSPVAVIFPGRRGDRDGAERGANGPRERPLLARGRRLPQRARPRRRRSPERATPPVARGRRRQLQRHSTSQMAASGRLSR